MKISIIGILVFSVFCGVAPAQKATTAKLKNSVDSVSYALAVLFGKNIQSGGFDSINTDIFAQTIQKVLDQELLDMTPEQANALVNARYQQVLKLKYEKNLSDSRAFLNANRKAAGVVTLPSGLQYKIITKGTGVKPSLTDKVMVHYHGTLIDGTIFDSTVERNQPIELTVNQVIPGWIEALQMMPAGSKWILYVPSELAYGENPRPGGPVEPNSALIFEVELLSVN